MDPNGQAILNGEPWYEHEAGAHHAQFAPAPESVKALRKGYRLHGIAPRNAHPLKAIMPRGTSQTVKIRMKETYAKFVEEGTPGDAYPKYKEKEEPRIVDGKARVQAQDEEYPTWSDEQARWPTDIYDDSELEVRLYH